MRHRGTYNNTTTTTYPSSNVLRGDLWSLTSNGILGTKDVLLSDRIIALVDNPGQLSSNWNHVQQSDYIPEDISNSNSPYGYPRLNSDSKIPLSSLTPIVLDDLSDVTITTPLDKQVVSYDSNTSKWINKVIDIPTQISNTSYYGSNSFTAIANTARTWTGSIIIPFDIITYSNTQYNLSSQIYLNASKYLTIDPVPYTRELSMQINFWCGGVSNPPITNLVFTYDIPASQTYNNAIKTIESSLIQHQLTGGSSNKDASQRIIIPENAYNFQVNMGTSPGNTSLAYIKIYGHLSS
jgi:hypothetical protein